MTPEEFRRRTRGFAVRIVRLVDALDHSGASEVMGRQLLRCGTSVGANYRAACRAKSRRDFISKMRIVEEECDEVLFWLDLLAATGRMPPDRLGALQQEGEEIISMVVVSVKTARRNLAARRQRPETPASAASANPQSPISNPQSLIPNPHPVAANLQSPIPNPQSVVASANTREKE